MRITITFMGIPGGSGVKHPFANAGDTGDKSLIPEWGRSPGVGNGKPLQYSYLGNPQDREMWQATVQGVTKSQTRLKQLRTHLRKQEDETVTVTLNAVF